MGVKGRFKLHPIDAKEAKTKLCKVVKQAYTRKGIPYIVTHDGRTIRYHDPLIKVNDTVQVNIATGKVDDIIKFDIGSNVILEVSTLCTSGTRMVTRSRLVSGTCSRCRS